MTTVQVIVSIVLVAAVVGGVLASLWRDQRRLEAEEREQLKASARREW